MRAFTGAVHCTQKHTTIPLSPLGVAGMGLLYQKFCGKDRTFLRMQQEKKEKLFNDK